MHIDDLTHKRASVAVVGLGYVGLPLAVALGRRFQVIGFDISENRVGELARGYDRTGEVEEKRLAETTVEFTSNERDLARAGVVIVAVPTPIDSHRMPDLGPVRSASATVGRNLAKGSVVVYESTVFPGLTEDICVPILEECSGLSCGSDFTVGYSPERINPGDKLHTLETIVKVVAGQDQATTELLAELYGSVVTAGIHKASSIKVAEAAKVIENTQRDLNIALMNELSRIFERMGIDTKEVLEAASTKWNFLPFSPGLVGGHCIGVDPYYLTYKAEEMGFHPEVILAGRAINDSMGAHVARTAVKLLNRGCVATACARVGVFGLTFKENVPDLRNTRVIDVIRELEDFGAQVLVHDPMVDPGEAEHEYGITMHPLDAMAGLDAVVLAVPHKPYVDMGADGFIARLRDPGKGVILDVKGALPREVLRERGIVHWRL